MANLQRRQSIKVRFWQIIMLIIFQLIVEKTRPRKKFQNNRVSQYKAELKLFDLVFDDLVSILSKDEALLCDLAKLVTSNLLKHPIDKEKVVRHSHSIIGSKILANAILIYISRARHPEYALLDLLTIFENYHKLEVLAGKIRERGMLLFIYKSYNFLVCS